MYVLQTKDVQVRRLVGGGGPNPGAAPGVSLDVEGTLVSGLTADFDATQTDAGEEMMPAAF